MGYCIRWAQEGFQGQTKGKVVYRDLDEAVSPCNGVTRRWRGEVQQWPVEYEVTKTGAPLRETRDLRHLMGIEKRSLS